MLSCLRQRSARLPRLLAWALLLLCVLAAPMASALGDVHALAHAGTETGADAHATAADDQAGDAGSLMHALMHGSHCHGHAVLLLPALPAWSTAVPAAEPPCPFQARPACSRVASLLRPPIAA
ncbi:hypothetical protein [Xanthomonas massiliensis]|uniref:hypothetical protein n=1 Tax=Xanthomonas massiliensis TaxID=1720302 RepID=UPI00082657B8|nr:hypothetical protein [Xanthomonas massiliensis]